MKATFSFYLLWLSFVVGIVQPIGGQIPSTISYQGILKNADNTIVEDGNYNFAFQLYDVSTGGTDLWSETHSSIPVKKGIYNVILGSNNPLNLPFDKQYWLSMAVNGEAELIPRIKLAISGFFKGLTCV